MWAKSVSADTILRLWEAPKNSLPGVRKVLRGQIKQIRQDAKIFRRALTASV